MLDLSSRNGNGHWLQILAFVGLKESSQPSEMPEWQLMCECQWGLIGIFLWVLIVIAAEVF